MDAKSRWRTAHRPIPTETDTFAVDPLPSGTGREKSWNETIPGGVLRGAGRGQRTTLVLLPSARRELGDFIPGVSWPTVFTSIAPVACPSTISLSSSRRITFIMGVQESPQDEVISHERYHPTRTHMHKRDTCTSVEERFESASLWDFQGWRLILPCTHREVQSERAPPRSCGSYHV